MIVLWGSNARDTHPIFFHHVLAAIHRGAKPKPEAAAALTVGREQIDSMVFMKPDMVVRERAGWITQWNRMIAAR
mgnify:CR=1 FL=1